MARVSYGFPATDVYSVPGVAGAEECDLQYARIYNSAATGGAHEVHGAILSKYLASGGPQARGLPKTDEHPCWHSLSAHERF